MPSHQINTDGPTDLTSVTMAQAVEHYMCHELANDGKTTTMSARFVELSVLRRRLIKNQGVITA